MWLDVPEQYIRAVHLLGKCDEKIRAFWSWHTAQFVEVEPQ